MKAEAQELFVVNLAQELFGWEGLFNWMLTPQVLLNNQRPVDLLETEEGRRELARVLEIFRTSAVI